MNPFDILIQSLKIPTCYGPEVHEVVLLETHISYVFLAGEYAYKIKKPLDLGFLDFSSLEKRRFYCREELRLNRRLAPDLYLDVIAISGSPENPAFDGDGPAIEYAVKMRQFPQEALLDRLEANGKLMPAHIDQLAASIATFHSSIPSAPEDSPFGSSHNIQLPVLENFKQIRPLLIAQEDIDRLSALQAWTIQETRSLEKEFAARKRGGFIRECHGDMHLGNMALIHNTVTIFDCIEFNENLRWIDVISEAAFFVMDLLRRNRHGLAYRFLNAYLEITGDYEGISVLRYYLVYRALVRAKVTCIRASQPGLADKQRSQVVDQYREYIRLAESFSAPPKQGIIINHGFSGSGKTTLTQTLLEHIGAIRARSDIERKRLFNMAPQAKSSAGIDSGIYSKEAGNRTYARLAIIAKCIVHAGYPVIVDATFLKLEDRMTFRALAEELDAPFIILDFQATEPILRARVLQREMHGTDASEAGVTVLEHQLATQQSFSPDEMRDVIEVDATQESIPAKVLERIQSALQHS